MIHEDIEIPNNNPCVPYHMAIRIEIKGKAPAKNGELPNLPLSFIEYLKRVINFYETNPALKKNYEGLFTLLSFEVEDI